MCAHLARPYVRASAGHAVTPCLSRPAPVRGRGTWLSGAPDDRIGRNDQLCCSAVERWLQTGVLAPATPLRTPPSVARWSSGPPEKRASSEGPESRHVAQRGGQPSSGAGRGSAPRPVSAAGHVLAGLTSSFATRACPQQSRPAPCTGPNTYAACRRRRLQSSASRWPQARSRSRFALAADPSRIDDDAWPDMRRYHLC
jgi:hypothetical protein